MGLNGDFPKRAAIGLVDFILFSLLHKVAILAIEPAETRGLLAECVDQIFEGFTVMRPCKLRCTARVKTAIVDLLRCNKSVVILTFF
jgi:hypothetical protein